MRVTYDPSSNAAYIYLSSEIKAGQVKKTYPCDPIEVGGQINLDFDAFGRLVGVEVLGATDKLPETLLQEAEIVT